MLYTYNENEIRFKKVKPIKLFLFFLLVITISIAGIYTSYTIGSNRSVYDLTEGELSILIQNMDEFSEEKLIEMMIDIGIKYPYIPYAQSKLETGGWKSSIFLENHNLFGMKQATRRVSTAKGSNKGHAYYDTWRESVYDYAFYQCRYLGNLNSEEEYFQYLSASYAEDSMYVQKLQKMIENEKLRERFN
jgi:hypothetical protein